MCTDAACIHGFGFVFFLFFVLPFSECVKPEEILRRTEQTVEDPHLRSELTQHSPVILGLIEFHLYTNSLSSLCHLSGVYECL